MGSSSSIMLLPQYVIFILFIRYIIWKNGERYVRIASKHYGIISILVLRRIII